MWSTRLGPTLSRRPVAGWIGEGAVGTGRIAPGDVPGAAGHRGSGHRGSPLRIPAPPPAGARRPRPPGVDMTSPDRNASSPAAPVGGAGVIETAGIDIIAESERPAKPRDLVWPWCAANAYVLGMRSCSALPSSRL